MGPQRRRQLGAIGFVRPVRPLRNHIGHKPLVAGAIVARHDGRIADKLVLAEPGGDLARLDAEAADLHLLVVAAQKLQIAIRQIAGQVAGAVHPGIRLAAERIGQEPLRRQFGPIEVAARNPCPADIELANGPERNRLTMVVKQIEPRVRDWAADRHICRCGKVCRDVMESTTDNRFRRTILVDHSGRRLDLTP